MSEIVYLGVAVARNGGESPLILADVNSPDKSPRGPDVRSVLSKVATTFSNTISEPQARYIYHVKVDAPFAPNSREPTLVLVCVTESEFPKQQSIECLETLKGFVRDIADLNTKGGGDAIEKGLQVELEPILVKIRTEAGSSEGKERLSAMRAQVNEVKTVMQNNVERVLERGERLDDLGARSAELENSSAQFQRNARNVRRQMCCRNAKCNLIIIALVIVAIIVIILVCYFEFKKSGGESATTQPPIITTKNTMIM